MNVRGAAMLLVMLAGVVMICAPGYAQEVNVVKWNAMVGWTSPGNKVSTIEGVGTPWFMTDGSAEVLAMSNSQSRAWSWRIHYPWSSEERLASFKR
jgi:cytochrome b subunit of formate dehydrogenase